MDRVIKHAPVLRQLNSLFVRAMNFIASKTVLPLRTNAVHRTKPLKRQPSEQ
jgi:hypothetical protein